MTITASEVSDGDTSNDSTLSLTFTSSQDTSNFTINDVTVSNGNLSNFQTVNSKVYTATFTPSGDGACTIDVAENKYTDTAGSNNEAADQFNWTYDGTNPAAFTVGSVVTTGGTIVSGYWNSTNLGLDITIPVSNDSTLTSGTIQLEAKVGNGSYQNLGTAYTIVSSDLNKDKTLSINANTFESLNNLQDGVVVTIRAKITDNSDNITTGSPSQTTINVDQSAPSAFTVGNVVATENTVVTNYWNSTNTGLNVTIPVANDSTLTGGTIQIKAKVDSGSYQNLGSAYTIVSNDLNNNKTISFNETTFEALNDLADNTVITITADIKDIAGNITTGTQSQNTITIDQASPDAFTVGTITATGGTVVSNYWNSTNTGLNVTIPVANDSTLTGGSIQVRAEVGNDVFENLGNAYTIVSNDLNKDKVISFTYSQFESLSGGLNDGEVISIKADIKDIAGNLTTGTKSSSTITVEQTSPTITISSTTSGVSDGSTSNDSSIAIKFTLSENSSNFVIGDVTLGNGQLTNFSGSNKIYTATFTPDSDGDCTINVSQNSFTDSAGNGNVAATEFNWKYDSTNPGNFTVGSVVTTGGTVVANYWNSTNTGIDITVPVANDSTLTGGSIQLRAKVGSADYEDLGSLYTIVSGDLGENKTLSNTAAVFEALSSGLADGEVVTITAIIKDKADNATTGTQSSTTITVDQNEPADFTVGSVLTTGGTVVSNYWNSTNTGVDISVPVANDSSLTVQFN